MRRWHLVVAAAVLAGAGWLLLRGGRRPQSPRAPSPTLQRRLPVFTSARPEAPAVPSWFAQPDLPATELAGRVVREGKGVAGAQVVLESQASAADPSLRRQAISGSDGSFRFGRQPAGAYELVAYAASNEPAQLSVDLRDPQVRARARRLSLELIPCRAVVSGLVTDGSAGPVSGARVVVLPPDGPARFGGPAVVTGSDGQYEICVAPAALRLRVEAAGRATALVRLREEELERRDVQLVGEVVLGGRTVDASSAAPLAAVQVNAWPLSDDEPGPGPSTTVTDAEGRFTLRGLRPHTRYSINAWRSDFVADQDLTVDVHPGPTAEVVRRLSPASRVSGVVQQQGRPVAGARVRAERSPYARSFTSVSQADGRFTLHGVPRGSDTLVVEGFRVVSPARLEVSAPEERELVLEVEPRR
jgi:hypothetical protein